MPNTTTTELTEVTEISVPAPVSVTVPASVPDLPTSSTPKSIDSIDSVMETSNATNGLIDSLEKEVELFKNVQDYCRQYLGSMNGEDFVALLKELGLGRYLNGLPEKQVELLLAFGFNVLIAVLLLFALCVAVIQIALYGTIRVVSKLVRGCKNAFIKCLDCRGRPSDPEAGPGQDMRALQKDAAEHGFMMIDPRILPYLSHQSENCKTCGTKRELPAAPVMCPAGAAHCVPETVPDVKVMLEPQEPYTLPVSSFFPDPNSIYGRYESVSDGLNTFGKQKNLNSNRESHLTERATIPNTSFLPNGARKRSESKATVRRQPKRRAPPPPLEVDVTIKNEYGTGCSQFSETNPFKK